jgi:hypothetical protein
VTNSSRHYHLDFRLLIVLLLMTWAGARGLNADGLWSDEWYSMLTSGADRFGPPQSPLDIWNRLAREDPWQTPGYFMLLAPWGQLVGWTEFASRALSLLCGALAVAATYRLGARLTGSRGVGLGAAVALAGSAWLIHYLHELRGYTLYAFLTAALFVLYIEYMGIGKKLTQSGNDAKAQRERDLRQRGREAEGQRRDLTQSSNDAKAQRERDLRQRGREAEGQRGWQGIGLFLTSLGLFYTHYFAALVVVVVGFWHLTWLLRRQIPPRRWWTAALWIGAAGLLFLPWLSNLFAAVGLAQGQNRLVLARYTFEQLPGVFIYIFSGTSVALFALLALVGLRSRGALTAWLLTGTLLGLGMVAFQALGLTEPRYMIGLAVPLALVAGIGFDRFRQIGVPLIVSGAVWFVGALAVGNDTEFMKAVMLTPPQPIREMAQAVRPYLTEGDVVINHHSRDVEPTLQDSPLAWYLGDLPARREIVEMRLLPDVQAFDRRLGTALGESRQAFLLYWPGSLSEERSLVTWRLNERGYWQCAALADSPQMKVLAFGRLDAGTWQFGEGVSVQPVGEPELLGGKLLVWLGFQLSDVPADTYSMAVHMVDANGALVAQQDLALPNQPASCRLAEINTSGLPAGEYRVRMTVYDWRTGERLPAGGPGVEADDFVAVGVVQK